jgi:ABC-type multidrug transport system fused ATPase/permease subunit
LSGATRRLATPPFSAPDTIWWSGSIHRIHLAVLTPILTMQEPDVPLFIECKDLNYEVDVKPTKQNPSKKRKLLHDVNAFFAPGELVAVMGPTGAGKRFEHAKIIFFLRSNEDSYW